MHLEKNYLIQLHFKMDTDTNLVYCIYQGCNIKLTDFFPPHIRHLVVSELSFIHLNSNSAIGTSYSQCWKWPSLGLYNFKP